MLTSTQADEVEQLIQQQRSKDALLIISAALGLHPKTIPPDLRLLVDRCIAIDQAKFTTAQPTPSDLTA